MTAGSSPRLTQQTTQGLAWMAFGSGTQLVVQIAVVGVLARLVDPRDYGLVAAMLVAVAALGGALPPTPPGPVTGRLLAVDAAPVVLAGRVR